MNLSDLRSWVAFPKSRLYNVITKASHDNVHENDITRDQNQLKTRFRLASMCTLQEHTYILWQYNNLFNDDELCN